MLVSYEVACISSLVHMTWWILIHAAFKSRQWFIPRILEQDAIAGHLCPTSSHKMDHLLPDSITTINPCFHGITHCSSFSEALPAQRGLAKYKTGTQQ